MKVPKLIGEIDSFKNKQDVGLFTFYIETSNPHSTISFNDIDQQHEHKKQKNQKGTKKIDNQNYEMPKIGQYRINSKPQRRLKTLQACTNSYYLVQKNNQFIDNQFISLNPPNQFDKVRELLTLKRQKNKKLLQELLVKNEVESQILDKFSKKKGLINPDKLIQSKKCSLNGFPKAGPLKSGYLSNVAKKMSKSFQKPQKICKNLSEQLIMPKQNLSIHEIKAFNDQLDIEFKLQQQKFRPNLFPFYKKRYSSHLKESQSPQMHPSSNDSLIQKLKNSSKLRQQKEKNHQKIQCDTSKTFRQQRENRSVTASQSKGKIMKQIEIPLDKSLVNKQLKQIFLQNQIDIPCFPRDRLSCFQKNKKPFLDQRNKNHSEIKKRNSLGALQNYSTLEKISRKKTGGSLQFSRKNQKCSDIPKNEQNSQQLLETKKNLMIIVKKVKDKYVSI